MHYFVPLLVFTGGVLRFNVMSKCQESINVIYEAKSRSEVAVSTMFFKAKVSHTSYVLVDAVANFLAKSNRVPVYKKTKDNTTAPRWRYFRFILMWPQSALL